MMVVAKKSSAQMVQRTCEVTGDVAGLRETVVKFTNEFQEYRRKSVVAQASRGFSRRGILAGMGLSLTALLLPKLAFARVGQISVGARATAPTPELLYPSVDLSYFNTPIGWRA